MESLQLHPSLSLFWTKPFNKVEQIRSDDPLDNNTSQHTPNLHDSIFLDSRSSVRILNSCAAERRLKLGSCIHSGVLKSGIDSSVFVGNAILDMYMKCGHLQDASELFDRMPERTVVSWTSMMSGYCQIGDIDGAKSIFHQMLAASVYPNEYTLSVLLQACEETCDLKLVQIIHGYIVANGFSDQFLQNTLINAYLKSGSLMAAEKLMEGLRGRDVVSWTSVISGCVVNGLMERALHLFFQMLEDGVIPNRVTIASIIHACSLTKKWQNFRWIHGSILKTELCNDALVMNSLVGMYCSNGYFSEGMRIFCEFCFRGEDQCLRSETMASLLQGCGHSGWLRLGKEMHGYLIKHKFFPCIMVENSLIDMYAENGEHESALQLFKKMRGRDIVSWNTIISCFVKNDSSPQALELFSTMHCNLEDELVVPDFITMLSAIQACSNLATFQLGQVIHGYITRTGLGTDVYVGNSLIDMYGNLGSMDLAEKIFEDMPVKDLASWNSIIAAYAINGNAIAALRLFNELIESELHKPNAITFVNVLSACGRAGFVEEGFEIFNSMVGEHGIEPSMEHFTCMVDLLGRSGQVEEATDFIKNMPLRPGPAAWGALLGACALFNNVEIAETAAEALSVLEPENKVWRVVLSNVYAGTGRWESIAKLRAEIKDIENLKKEAGCSSVEVRGDYISFTVGDTRHHQSKNIYKALDGIMQQIKDVAYVDIGIPRWVVGI